MTRLAFLASALALGYTFVGYALAMRLRARYAPRPVDAADWQPRVDLVMVAYNAAAELPAKLANLRALDYPADRLRIHIASDGSEDLTAALLRECDDPRVTVHVFPQRRGKSACLGDLVAGLDGEIVVFTDVRQRIEADAIRALLRPLADPSVGAVSGELMFERGEGDFAGGVDFYWRYEKLIRRSEADSGSVVGVSGALYAARRSLLPAIPPGLILDDLWIPLEIARRGARVVFAADARAWDRPSGDAELEARRKRRTLAGNFQLIARQPSLLLPWTHPLGWRLWGHKWLRLLAPWLLLVVLLTNAQLAPTSTKWLLLLLAQLGFYAAALAGLWRPSLTRHLVLRIAATFVRMNGYAVLGLFDFLRGGSAHLWSVTRHAEAERT
ncbi:glycosyltransferase family 2 protein [Dokdonella sp.]|uniref:glycosyltransferase family 2 protein n=1 Tax=Dokdonella sp. TaxID=2291710 RepID=UPI001B22920D|nr:glycosyltransferase family 2 protein [Dokdonella sp.]MBO9661989.1 glycosyltransferase family 2 protein [Dokdonella sp.]